MNAKQQMKGMDFFASHPVFSLDEAVAALTGDGKRSRVIDRLKYHLKTGRLKRVTREIYAVVPPGRPVNNLIIDPFLVAKAMHPDGVFSHHSAMELLGAAYSVWNQYTIYVAKRRRPLHLDGTVIRFLDSPVAMQSGAGQQFGARKVERQGVLLNTTGPERTLVEGFNRPALAGGLEELVRSAAGFTTLDLDLLEEVLRRYGQAKLWAAVGWFLEMFQKSFHVPDDYLTRIEKNRPHSRLYAERVQRGGTLARRWNLILPPTLSSLGEPDER